MKSSSKSLPLITVNEKEEFIVHQEAIQLLNKYHTPIAVVAVAGKYRTGKSYLLNILTGDSCGFEVGNTVNACTKGIWLYTEPHYDAEKNIHVFFMDSEGLGSTTRSSTHDSRVFALSLLISSFFIYNSRGVIDGQAIEDLSLVANLTEIIHVKAGHAEQDDGKTLSQFFPTFLWIVRDFSLKLEDEKGSKITSNQYLENCLKPQSGFSEAVVSKNRLRKLIVNFFRERECMTLVRPAEEENILKNLSAQPLTDLRPEFQRQIKIFVNKVFSGVRPKSLMGRTLNGEMLTTLIQSYVDALNSGGVPEITSAWSRVVATQCQEALTNAIVVYGESLISELKKQKRNQNSNSTSYSSTMLDDLLPLDPQVLLRCHEYAKSTSKIAYKSKLMDPFEQTAIDVCRSLRMELRSRLNTLMQTNHRVSEKLAMQLINEKLDTIGRASRGEGSGSFSPSDVSDVTSSKALFISDVRHTLSSYASVIGDIETNTKLSGEQMEYLGPAVVMVSNKALMDRVIEELCTWAANIADSFREVDGDIKGNMDIMKRDVNEISALITAQNMMLDQQVTSNNWSINEVKERLKHESEVYEDDMKRKDIEISRYEKMLDDVSSMHQKSIANLRLKQDTLRKRLESERENVLEEQKKLGGDMNQLKVETRTADRQRLIEQHQLEESLAKQLTHIKDLKKELDELGVVHVTTITRKSQQFFNDIKAEEMKQKQLKDEIISQLNEDQQRDEASKANELKKLRDMIKSKQTSVAKLESGELETTSVDSGGRGESGPLRRAPSVNQNIGKRNSTAPAAPGGKGSKRRGDACKPS